MRLAISRTNIFAMVSSAAWITLDKRSSRSKKINTYEVHHPWCRKRDDCHHCFLLFFMIEEVRSNTILQACFVLFCIRSWCGFLISAVKLHLYLLESVKFKENMKRIGNGIKMNCRIFSSLTLWRLPKNIKYEYTLTHSTSVAKMLPWSLLRFFEV